jgi:short-subunit dehydrogenase
MRGGAIGLGASAADHPWLSASLMLAHDEATVFTGRLTAADAAWASIDADHSALAPSALLELVLAAGQRAGAFGVDRLRFEAPLHVAERTALQLQVLVGAANAEGMRAIGVHSRPEDAAQRARAPWSEHVTGELRADAPVFDTTALAELRSWPPEGAHQLELPGPAIERVSALYQRDGELFIAVDLGAPLRDEAARYGQHPLLLQALFEVLSRLDGGERDVLALEGLCLASTGAAAARVRARRGASGAWSLGWVDDAGEPAGQIVRLEFGARRGREHAEPWLRDALFQVAWSKLSPPQPSAAWVSVGSDGDAYADITELTRALAADVAPAADVVLQLQPDPHRGVAEAATELAQRALTQLQAWSNEPRLAERQLLLVTRSALAAASGDDVGGLAQAPLWGLGRALQTEHPDRRIKLLDVPADLPLTAAELAGALGADAMQLALRAGELLAPRLRRAPAAPSDAAARARLAERLQHGTVLITGGSGTLAAIVAEHLVERYGARQLLLCSRSGRADALAARLEQQGASVRVTACDVSQRAALVELLASISPQQPLAAVFHTAAVLDDGVFAAQTGERLAGVFAPKLLGAWHLHELTRAADLAAFVLFSSLAGVLGAAGQSNYAAANTFLDALAQQRRAQGLAGTSLAWGAWSDASAMTSHLTQADRERIARAGVLPLTAAEGMVLLDAALAGDGGLWVPARFDARYFERDAESMPPLLAGLGRRRLRRSEHRGSPLQLQLGAHRPAERERALLQLIRETVSVVIGAPAASIEAERPLRELGLDSLMSLELRNRLAALSGLPLPSTLAFDHPTPAALCRYLASALADERPQLERRRATASPLTAAGEPVAIVAMSCRFPNADSPEALWDVLREGVDVIGEFPRDRGWDVDGIYDPDPEARGKTTVVRGGFLDTAADFDAAFFNISPREALAMDPQQRLLLEIAWEALERASIDPRRLVGSATGVFIGVAPNAYAGGALHGELEGYGLTGGAGSVASGRISYALGLEGPAVTLDTACSSSLVALHLASQSLRSGESDLALSGAASVLATPWVFVEFSRQRGLAPDGRCKPFADAADGTSWSEGASMLVLERLADARRNDHPVLALVRGSAINQDGKSQGLTAPNGPAQERVIRQALANAGLSADDIDVVEAHGTGTTLGDPIGAPPHVRRAAPGRAPAVSRRGEVQPGSHAAGGGRGRTDQAGAGARAPRAAEELARRRADATRRLVRGDDPAADRERGLAGARQAAARRGLGVRHQRHQRARDRGRAAADGGGDAQDARPGVASVLALGAQPGGAARAGTAAARARERASRARAARSSAFARRHAQRLRAARDRARRHARTVARHARSAGRGRTGRAPDRGPRAQLGRAGGDVHGPRQPAPRHGSRPVRERSGVPSRARRNLRRLCARAAAPAGVRDVRGRRQR